MTYGATDARKVLTQAAIGCGAKVRRTGNSGSSPAPGPGSFDPVAALLAPPDRLPTCVKSDQQQPPSQRQRQREVTLLCELAHQQSEMLITAKAKLIHQHPPKLTTGEETPAAVRRLRHTGSPALIRQPGDIRARARTAAPGAVAVRGGDDDRPLGAVDDVCGGGGPEYALAARQPVGRRFARTGAGDCQPAPGSENRGPRACPGAAPARAKDRDCRSHGQRSGARLQPSTGPDTGLCPAGQDCRWPRKTTSRKRDRRATRPTCSPRRGPP